MLRSRTGVVGTVLLVAFLVGCTELIHSDRLPPCDQKECPTPQPGFSYSLPKGQFLLQASRHQIAEPDLTAAADAVAKANAAVKADLESLAKANQKLTDDNAKKPPSPATIEDDENAIANLKESLNADRDILKITTKILSEKKKDKMKYTETFTLTQQSIAPDPKARYVADLNHSCFRDDKIQIGLSNGLLTSASTTSVDQSLNLLVSLAETAISVATFAVSGIPLTPGIPQEKVAAAMLARGEKPGTPLQCSYDIAEVFDPLDPDDVKRVNDILKAQHATGELCVNDSSTARSSTTPCVPLITPPPTTVPTPPTSEERPGVSGLAYRVPVPVIVTVQAARAVDNPESEGWWQMGGPSWNEGGKQIRCLLQSKPGAQSVLGILPDSRRDYRLPTDASPFTTTTLSYSLASGMLTEYDVTRPSEAVAPVAAVGTLAKDILAIPGSILKLRLDYTNSSADLVKAQTALINNRADQAVAGINARTSLENAKAALIKAQFGDKQAWVDAQQSLISAEQALQKLIAGGTGATTTPTAGTSASP